MRLKRADQDGILEACWLSLRPISVRNVGASGTKGVGWGGGGGIRRPWRRLRDDADGVDAVEVDVLALRKWCDLDRGAGLRTSIVVVVEA